MVNMFMKIVDKSVPFKIKYIFKYFRFRKEFKTFKKKISNGSPSFSVLWEFADFIKFSEIIFGLDKTGLYSSNEYKAGENGFKITTDERIILIKLFTETLSVAIDIDNKNGARKKSSYIFINNEWDKEPDDYDIFFINLIIQIINNTMLHHLERCINKKFEILFNV